MSLYLGPHQPEKCYVGGQSVQRIYAGDQLVWSPAAARLAPAGRESGAVYHALYSADNPTGNDIDGGQPYAGTAPTLRSLGSANYEALRLTNSRDNYRAKETF